MMNNLYNTSLINYVTIYTDGSWKHQKNTGGWACLIVQKSGWFVLSGGVTSTSIIRMELLAVAMSLEALEVPSKVIIVSDSMFTVSCINEWIARWSRNNWNKSNGQRIENIDLISRIFNQMNRHAVMAVWVKSHTDKRDLNSLGNACVDWFAQYSADKKYKQ